MLTISKIWKEEHGEYTYAMAELVIDEQDCINWKAYCERKENRYFTKYMDEDYVSKMSGNSTLWYAVDQKYGEDLCVDRADAFLLSMLHFSLASGTDIKSDVPVSAELMYHIQTEIIPHMCIGPFRKINVEAPVTYEIFSSKGAAATGMSCGIDSFFTVWQNTQESIPDNFKVKYLTFFNVGAINGVFTENVDLNRRNQLMLEFSKKKADEAKIVADVMGLELIFINSNISDYYRGMLVNSAHYRNCGTAMLMQGLWNKYYYSSAGFMPDDIKYDLCDDPAFQEAMLLPWFSNGTISFISAGHAYSRIQKTAILADYNLAQKFLNVCDRDMNCGKCIKCKRTISSLLALNKLDNFEQCFDVPSIKRDINYYKMYIFFKRKMHYYDEIFDAAQKKGFYTRLERILYSVLYIPYSILHKNKFWEKSRIKKYDKEVRTIK